MALAMAIIHTWLSTRDHAHGSITNPAQLTANNVDTWRLTDPLSNRFQPTWMQAEQIIKATIVIGTLGVRLSHQSGDQIKGHCRGSAPIIPHHGLGGA